MPLPGRVAFSSDVSIIYATVRDSPLEGQAALMACCFGFSSVDMTLMRYIFLLKGTRRGSYPDAIYY